MIDLSAKRILVTGGAGFLGQNIVRVLRNRGCKDVVVPRFHDFDLRFRDDVLNMLDGNDPQIIIHAAAQAGGIGLNKAKPGELFYNNAIMGIQLMHESHMWGTVEKFVQIGTVCEYPCFSPIPFQEINLWDGHPEPTNAAYGISKRALLTMGQAYRAQYGFNVIHLLPVNLYGPNDNFREDSSHVIPALIRKFVEAKKNNENVTIWGNGEATREFLYVEDCAEAIVRATESYDEPEPLNIGAGYELPIKELASIIGKLLDFKGEVVYDISKPNGQPRRLLDTWNARVKLNWGATTLLMDGLKKTIDWYLTQGDK